MTNADREKFDEAVAARADELFANGDVIAEWLVDYADEDDLIEFAVEAFLVFVALRGGVDVRSRLDAPVVRRLLTSFEGWCDERAREAVLREARESREYGEYRVEDESTRRADADGEAR